MSMTIQEALQTDEVKAYIQAMIDDGVQAHVDSVLEAAVTKAVDEQLPTIRESVRADIRQEDRVRVLSTEASRLIQEARIHESVKPGLLEDYGVAESDSGDVEAGRALRVIEAVVDKDGKVQKTDLVVLRESVEDDLKRHRLQLRESAPSVPRAPGGGDRALAPDGGGPSPDELRKQFTDKGLDPETYGLPPIPSAAT